jgi:hypothetical protein
MMVRRCSSRWQRQPLLSLHTQGRRQARRYFSIISPPSDPPHLPQSSPSPVSSSLRTMTNTEIMEIHLKYLTDVALEKNNPEKHPFLVDFDEVEFMRGVSQAFENINEVLADKKFQIYTQGSVCLLLSVPSSQLCSLGNCIHQKVQSICPRSHHQKHFQFSKLLERSLQQIRSWRDTILRAKS